MSTENIWASNNISEQLFEFTAKSVPPEQILEAKISYQKVTGEIFEDDICELWSFPLKHKIPCWGFKLLEKKKPRKIIKSAIEQ